MLWRQRRLAPERWSKRSTTTTAHDRKARHYTKQAAAAILELYDAKNSRKHHTLNRSAHTHGTKCTVGTAGIVQQVMRSMTNYLRDALRCNEFDYVQICANSVGVIIAAHARARATCLENNNTLRYTQRCWSTLARSLCRCVRAVLACVRVVFVGFVLAALLMRKRVVKLSFTAGGLKLC